MPTARAAKRNAERWASNQAARERIVTTIRAKAIPEADTGLAWLLKKHRVDPIMAKAGRLYGVWFSSEREEGIAPIVSCLATAGMPHGQSGEGDMSNRAQAIAHSAAFRMDALRRLQEARDRLGRDTGLVLVCDVLCGLGKRPREVTTVQREAEALANSAWVALKLLVEHLDEVDAGWRARAA